MIHPQLFKQAWAIEPGRHKTFGRHPEERHAGLAAPINSTFVAAAEFGDACCEFPVVFVHAGEEAGKTLYAPIAVLGLSEGQNLYWEAERFRAHYQPALLRAYPVGIGRTGPNSAVMVIDEASPLCNAADGEALFDADGKPTPFFETIRQGMEQLETEIQRTRFLGQTLSAHDLMQPMRFDATLPDGSTLGVDGFFIVSEEKLAKLPDATVLELHKNGVLALIHAHLMSLRHMRRLAEWHTARGLSGNAGSSAQAPAVAAANAPTVQ